MALNRDNQRPPSRRGYASQTSRRPGSRPSRSASSRAPRAVSNRQRNALISSSNQMPSQRSSSQRTTRVSSVTVGEVQRSVRSQRAQETYRRYVVRVIATFACIVCLVVAGFVLYYSDLFSIDEVTVEGVEHLTSEEMSQISGVPTDTTLLRVDSKTIRNNIMRDAWVLDVDVQRQFPHTLNLAVTEREIAATVVVSINDGASSQLWAISEDGMWLCPIPNPDSEEAKSVSPQIYEDAENVFSITDVPYGLVPEVGAYCSDESVNNAIAVVTGLTTELKDQVAKVSATSTETTTLTLTSGVEIAFGKAEDIRTKERVCLQLIEDNPGKVAYINVRVVSSPTWRAL